MIEVTNATRANSALGALKEFVEQTNVDTARDAIADMICNLIHLPRGRGLDPERLVKQALGMAAEEAAEDPEGDMEAVQQAFRTLLSEDD
ncbi:MAG: hypothetical protein K2W81_13720 [Sphingomonas sp.]|uniref:hypothetical protein n=1 Tax=Sphingomonas sp. TaxID=28214 RepID=UPI0025F3D4AE|nr:hypothetical protein [Sphingomonas sp.]MBY0285004.1 hypothetical protein [Sphingomonas sp.]